MTVNRSGRELNDPDKQAAGLASQRQAEVAQALVDTETEIATLKARLDNQSKLLVGVGTLPTATGVGDESEMAITYKIVRLKIDGAATTMAADENTLLVPGDVLEVVGQAAAHGG